MQLDWKKINLKKIKEKGIGLASLIRYSWKKTFLKKAGEEFLILFSFFKI